MRNLNLLIICSLFIFSCNKITKNDVSTNMDSTKISIHDSIRDGIFIHITESYNDPHKVLMPLKMANMMAKDKDVIVYLDIHGVEFLAKGSKDINFADFESAHTYLKALVDKKVGVYACPTCLKIAGIDPSNLIDGIQVAQKDKFFNFTKGRIITLDY
jgi:predicted peroxiredoxin